MRRRPALLPSWRARSCGGRQGEISRCRQAPRDWTGDAGVSVLPGSAEATPSPGPRVSVLPRSAEATPNPRTQTRVSVLPRREWLRLENPLPEPARWLYRACREACAARDPGKELNPHSRSSLLKYWASASRGLRTITPSSNCSTMQGCVECRNSEKYSKLNSAFTEETRNFRFFQSLDWMWKHALSLESTFSLTHY